MQGKFSSICMIFFYSSQASFSLPPNPSSMSLPNRRNRHHFGVSKLTTFMASRYRIGKMYQALVYQEQERSLVPVADVIPGSNNYWELRTPQGCRRDMIFSCAVISIPPCSLDFSSLQWHWTWRCQWRRIWRLQGIGYSHGVGRVYSAISLFIRARERMWQSIGGRWFPGLDRLSLHTQKKKKKFISLRVCSPLAEDRGLRVSGYRHPIGTCRNLKYPNNCWITVWQP